MSSQRPRNKRDVVFVYSRSKKRGSYRVVRAREDRLELGELREPKDGERIDGELVKLKRREEHEQLFDVEAVEPTDAPAAAHDGPAQVATESYRKNWDSIFGGKNKPKSKRPKYLN